MGNLLTVGSVAFDTIETPFGKAERILGGAGTYISLAASYFRKPVQLVSVVGSDFRQKDILMMQEAGIDTSGIQQKTDEKSFFWAGKYFNDMNHRDTLETQLNVLGTFDPVIPESYKSCDYLMLGNLSPAVQQLVIERLPVRPKLVVMDTMNFWISSFMDDLKIVIENVDVLIINEEEARQLTGQYSLVVAAREINAMGPNIVVIKKGEHGALLFYHGQIFFVPALPLEVVFDPTGAGDTFAGGFIGHIARQDSFSFETMKDAMVYGSAMASFCVEKFGVEGILNLSSEEIENRVKVFRSLVQ